MARADVTAMAGYGHGQSKGDVNAISRLWALAFVDYLTGGRSAARVRLLEGVR